jgi:hypothetical protein
MVITYMHITFQASCPVGIGGPLPGRDAHHSPPTNAEVKNA